MRKFLLLLLCISLAVSQLWAQSRVLSGTVTDGAGNPLPGASVLVKGTSEGTTTNAAGNFNLTVSASARALVISYQGYAPQELAIGSRTSFSVSLKTADVSLDEVVIVGYQAQRKRDVTAAISRVTGEDIRNLPMQTFDRALQGRAAGVAVNANNGIPGGAVNVRIRGVGSISAGNEPLYVVDGVQINNTTGTNFNTQTNPLAFLNPNDIESIEVLKDAGAAAIYGARAANGVILVTTKKGRQGRTNITANVYYGITSPLKYFDVLNSQEYFAARQEALMNSGNSAAAARTTTIAELRLPATITDKEIAELPTYDWQSEAFKQGQVKNIDLALSGGSDRNTFYISGSYNKQDAIVFPVNFERGTFLSKLSNKLSDKLTLETQINLSTTRQGAPFATDGSFLGSPAFSSSLILPTNPIYNADGSFFGLLGSGQGFGGILNNNIVAVANYLSAYQRSNQAVGNLALTYNVATGLTYRGTFGLDYRLIQGDSYGDPRLNDYFNRRGLSQVASTWNTNFITFHTLNYLRTFGQDHNVAVLAGTEYRNDMLESISASGENFPSIEFRNLGSAAIPLNVGGTKTASKTFSLFSKVTYDFAKRYLASFTIRRDGSSRFGENNRYGIFPSVSVGWNIKGENFLRDNTKITDLKLRFSYGQNGNDQIGNFDSRGLFGATRIYNNAAGISPTQLANPDLKWEVKEESNLGLDFGFFKNRLSGSIDAYRKVNRDLLLSRSVFGSTGFTSFRQNVGSVENKGIELLLRGQLISSADFNWTSTFTFAYNKNQVLSLFEGRQFLPGDASTRVGSSLGSNFVARYAGVNPATGRPMWYDSTGNITYLILNRDQVVIGSVLPKFTGGLQNSINFKNFELDAFFNYDYGRQVSDGQVNFLSEIGGRSFNALSEVYDRRWTKPGDITDVPRGINGNSEVRASGAFGGSRTFVKADYIRLKQLTLGYNFPTSLIRNWKLTAAKFYVQAVNLLTISDYPGYDPEFVGSATGIVPQGRNVTFGLQVGF